jgi:hypothetical protein
MPSRVFQRKYDDGMAHSLYFAAKFGGAGAALRAETDWRGVTREKARKKTKKVLDIPKTA